jgi:hypothetical protein
LEGELGEDLLVELVLLGTVGSVERVGEGDKLGSIGRVSRSREARVFGFKGGEGLVTEVKGLRSIPFGKVGDEVFRRGERLREGFLRKEMNRGNEVSWVVGDVQTGKGGRVFGRTKVMTFGFLT